MNVPVRQIRPSASNMEKLIIIGTGCAGLTAAIYAARASFDPLVLEGREPGALDDDAGGELSWVCGWDRRADADHEIRKRRRSG